LTCATDAEKYAPFVVAGPETLDTRVAEFDDTVAACAFHAHGA
jgi:hypothetical protein